MTKLFISYAHLDSGIVLNISRELQEKGYEVWIDKYGLQGGDLWVSEIVKGIRSCDIFLLFVSANSASSEYVSRELFYAFHEKRKIIHIMLEKTELPDEWIFYVARLQYIDYQDPDWKTQFLNALGGDGSLPALTVSEPAKNSYSSLPVLELVERSLIFSNREKELQRALEQIKKHRLLLVTGMPGIGKSAFARALLDSRPADAPEPFWYHFEHQQSTGNTLSVLLDRLSGHLESCFGGDVRSEVMAFRDPTGTVASKENVDVLIKHLDQDKPVWLVFDNLETVLSRETGKFLDEGLETLFTGLKTGRHSAKIIITNPFIPVMQNGEQYIEDGTEALALEGLEDDAEIEFLQAYGLQKLPKDALFSIVRETNGHPFILNQVARYIRAVGITAATRNLQANLKEISGEFGLFLKRRLSRQEFNALRSLTVLNREISLEGLCQVARVKRVTIVNLKEIGLLQRDEADNFWMHNIVRNSLTPVEPRGLKQAHLRAMNYYCSREVNLFPQSIDDCANLLEWHYHAVRAGEAASAYEALYSTGLEAQLLKWNEYDLLGPLCEQTLALDRLEREGLSNLERVSLHRTLGTIYFYGGDFRKSIAHLTTGVDLLSEPAENQDLKVALLIELAESYDSSQDFVHAMEICGQAQSLVSGLHNESLQAKVAHLKGIIHRDRGNLEQSIADFKEALQLYEKLMDHIHIVNAMVDLGVVYYQKNQFAEAVATYTHVISFCEEIEDQRGVMIARYNIGAIHLLDEQLKSAAADLQVALEIALEKKFAWMEVLAGLDFAEAQIGLLELESAEKQLNHLKPLIAKHASSCESGRELALIARLHWRRQQMEQARDYFQRAFKLLANDCPEHLARTYLAFAGFMKEQGHLGQARDALLQARNIFMKLNNQLGLNAVERALEGMQKDPQGHKS